MQVCTNVQEYINYFLYFWKLRNLTCKTLFLSCPFVSTLPPNNSQTSTVVTLTVNAVFLFIVFFPVAKCQLYLHLFFSWHSLHLMKWKVIFLKTECLVKLLKRYFYFPLMWLLNNSHVGQNFGKAIIEMWTIFWRRSPEGP